MAGNAHTEPMENEGIEYKFDTYVSVCVEMCEYEQCEQSTAAIGFYSAVRPYARIFSCNTPSSNECVMRDTRTHIFKRNEGKMCACVFFV